MISSVCKLWHWKRVYHHLPSSTIISQRISTSIAAAAGPLVVVAARLWKAVATSVELPRHGAEVPEALAAWPDIMDDIMIIYIYISWLMVD
jgi:hypothetical protein